MRFYIGRRLGPLWLGASKRLRPRLAFPAIPPQHRLAFALGFAFGAALVIGGLYWLMTAR